MQFKKVEKPWGYFITIWKEENINIKIIHVNPKSRLSLQSHKFRNELWILLEGNLTCQIGNKKIKMKKNTAYFIPKKTKHRLCAQKKGGKILEISFGKFDEKDIIRYEDDYGRVTKKVGT